MQRVLMKQKRITSFQPAFYYIPFSKFSAVWPYRCLWETAQRYVSITGGKFPAGAPCSAPWAECSPSWAEEDAARFPSPAAAANKPSPTNAPEAIQILSASPSCHQRCRQPAPRTQPVSSKSMCVYAKERDAKIEFLAEGKICSPTESCSSQRWSSQTPIAPWARSMWRGGPYMSSPP